MGFVSKNVILITLIVTGIIGTLQLSKYIYHYQEEMDRYIKRQEEVTLYEVDYQKDAPSDKSKSFHEQLKDEFDFELKMEAKKKDMQKKREAIAKNILHDPKNQKYLQLTGIAVNVLTILTLIMALPSVIGNPITRFRYRYLLLPYIIHHLLVIVGTLALIVMMIVYKNTTLLPILIPTLCFFPFFVAFTIKYFKILSRMATVEYNDLQEIKTNKQTKGKF